jgi:hypothetical protein
VEKANGIDTCGATVTRGAGSTEQAHAEGRYTVECRGADGTLKWVDVIDNLVTTDGKNFNLDTFLGGSAYTAAWYIGLIAATSYSAVAAGDTMASHAGWLEAGGANAPAYSEGARQTPTFAAASAGAKGTSTPVVFTMTSSGTAKGCFLASSATKDGTTGRLYSAGLFSQGDKVLGAGDTLSVSYSASL